MLTFLTGKGYDDWDMVVRAEEEKFIPASDSYTAAAFALKNRPFPGGRLLATGIGLMGLLSAFGLGFLRKKQS
jgi:hypothetical protein